MVVHQHLGGRGGGDNGLQLLGAVKLVEVQDEDEVGSGYPLFGVFRFRGSVQDIKSFFQEGECVGDAVREGALIQTAVGHEHPDGR